MRFYFWLIPVIFLAGITGTTSVEGKIGIPKGGKKLIVAFGDSLTSGYGVDRDATYPALLEKKLKNEGFVYRVLNAGISGDTTSGGVGRVDSVIRLRPEIVILELGANDGFRGVTLKIIRENLSLMIEKLQREKIKLLLAGMKLPPNYGEDYTVGFYATYIDLSRKYKVPLIPFFLEGIAGDPSLNQGDDIHPTARGYQRVIDNIWPHLVLLLSKE